MSPTQSQLDDLLASVNLLVAKDEEIKALSEWDFNIFRIAGIDWRELSHSAFLANLLNPKGTHRLGAQFLRAFLNQIGQPEWCKSCDTATVRTEQETARFGRLDIVIQTPAWTLVIENKILAAEQEQQIERYQKWLSEQLGEKLLIYLTLDGQAATTKSDQEPIEVHCISYRHDILQWIHTCIQLASERPFVRETLRQYENAIKQITGQNMEQEQLNHTIDAILKSQESFVSASAIANAFGEAKSRVAQQLFRKAIDAYRTSHQGTMIDLLSNEDLTASDNGVDFGDFGVVRGRFEFDNSNLRSLCVGLKWKDKKTLEELSGKWNNKGGKEFCEQFGMKSSHWWPCWEWMPTCNWDDETLANALASSNTSKLMGEVTKALEKVENVAKSFAERIQELVRSSGASGG